MNWKKYTEVGSVCKWLAGGAPLEKQPWATLHFGAWIIDTYSGGNFLVVKMEIIAWFWEWAERIDLNMAWNLEWWAASSASWQELNSLSEMGYKERSGLCREVVTSVFECWFRDIRSPCEHTLWDHKLRAPNEFQLANQSHCSAWRKELLNES